MDYFLNNTKFLGCKSLILSILIHLLFFNLFIFVFPTLNEKSKPKFIFLGSLLQKQDIYYFSRNKNINKNHLTLNKYSYESMQSSEHPIKNIAINKPKLKHVAHKEEKNIIVIPFNIPEINKKDGDVSNVEEDVNLDIKTKFHPYKPLSIYNK